MSKLAIWFVLGASVLGGCVPAAQPYSPYAYRHHRHVVYVDGVTYVDRGVAYGEAPPDTVIPTEDPEVGAMTAPTPSAVVEQAP